MASRHFIALIALIATLGSMNAEGGLFDPPDAKRETAIRDYLQRNPQVPMDLDKPLATLIGASSFQTNGVRYFLDRESLQHFRIELKARSEEIFGKQTPSQESKEIPSGQSIYDDYYLIDTNGVYFSLLIVLTTNGAFKTGWRTYSLEDYSNRFIRPDQQAPEITSHKYKSGWQNGTIFDQTVYTQEHDVCGILFHEKYSYTWYPRILDYHGIPILNNINIPSGRGYSCYLLAKNQRFLVTLSFQDESAEGLAKCQERALEILKGIRISE
ncbi:MAG: hypothetical protein WCG03_06725 [Kiritimatiellales bacterium]